MVQFLLGLILMVLLLGFWGDEIAESITQFGFSTAETMVSMPLWLQIFLSVIVFVFCILNIIRIIRNPL